MGNVDLAVVIPTTHHVQEVLSLIEDIRSTSPVATHVTVVDNGPMASAAQWGHEDVIVCREFLGSEQGFVSGLGQAPPANRYLLLDHDAVLDGYTLPVMMDLPRTPWKVYSANHGGQGQMWDRVDAWPPRDSEVESPLRPIVLAPWSGLLLPEGARAMVISQSSGYFFGWDDYLASWRLRAAGFTLQGVIAAQLGNRGRGNEWLSPWRTYYQARNHILFYRDTGLGSVARLVELRMKLLVASLIKLNGERGLGISLGLADGIANVRGMTLLPGTKPSTCLSSRVARNKVLDSIRSTVTSR